MIILDEHLGKGIRDDLKWVSGKVISLQDDYPGIQDDSIITLLHEKKNCAFITANVRHFWHEVTINNSFCIVCFGLPSKDFHHIPRLLRLLFKKDGFPTQKLRNGHVFRVSINETADYYSWTDRQHKHFEL